MRDIKRAATQLTTYISMTQPFKNDTGYRTSNSSPSLDYVKVMSNQQQTLQQLFELRAKF